jgi:hypothetical protein
MYREGSSLAEIGTDQNVSSGTAYRRLAEVNEPMRPDGTRPFDVERAIRLYRTGATLREVGADQNVSYGTARRRMEKAGEPIRDYFGGERTAETLKRMSLAKRADIPEETLRELCAQGLTSREIASQLEWSEETVRRAQIRLGIDRLPGKARPWKNSFWRGGATVDDEGYILQKVAGHPNATVGGYVRVHRLMMEAHIGRLLEDEEVVDHKNRDTSDNRIENLHLYPTNGDHLRETCTGRPNLPAEERERLRQAAYLRGRDRLAAILEESGSDDALLPLPDGHPLSQPRTDDLGPSETAPRLSMSE